MELPVRAGSRLGDLADTVRTVIRVAAQGGRTHARITLHPAELGEVQIRLRYEATGLVTEVLAESQQAVQALQQAAPELRRSLEAQGLTVLWLDVKHGGADDLSRWLHGAAAARREHVSADADAESDEHIVPAGRLPLAGATVDVLA
jgi:hypothetical protein